MKRNTFYIDNRAEWKIKKVISENDISSHQFTNLFQYSDIDHSKSKPQKMLDSLQTAITSFRYIFN